MPDPVAEHKSHAPASLSCAVITVSDTRNLDTDSGGAEVVRQLETAGHVVVHREIVPDEPSRVEPLVQAYRDDPSIDAVLVTGGTGIAARDQTYEVVRSLLTKELPGYGELFRMLSYQEIGPAAMLSRAVGGLANRTVVLTMPGSPAGVRLAMEQVILPELGHLVHEAQR